MDVQPTPTEERHERVADEQKEHKALQAPGRPATELPAAAGEAE